MDNFRRKFVKLGCCQRVFLSWNSLAISRTPPKFLKILVLFVPHTREFLRRELEHVSRPGGGGCESSRTLAPSIFLFRCFLFGRAISVFSERFFNRLCKKKIGADTAENGPSKVWVPEVGALEMHRGSSTPGRTARARVVRRSTDAAPDDQRLRVTFVKL